MSVPMEIVLTQETWNEISRHSQEKFPEECCGVVLSNGVRDQARRVENIQNKLHALDPATYPRTAAIAYAMDPRELESVLDEAGKSGNKLKAFYHSHPDHEAYFSAEDKAFATPFGEPTFPSAVQIVVSVYNRVIKDIKAFAWSDDRKDFVALPIRKI
jgi:[CysO sulfur-carrier protein]-S-L-cysteine hydrolase